MASQMQRPQLTDAGAALFGRQAERLSPFGVESKLSTSPQVKSPQSGANLPQGWRPRTPNRGRLCGYQWKKAARRRPSTKVLATLRLGFFRETRRKVGRLNCAPLQISTKPCDKKRLVPIARIKSDSIPKRKTEVLAHDLRRTFDQGCSSEEVVVGLDRADDGLAQYFLFQCCPYSDPAASIQ